MESWDTLLPHTYAYSNPNSPKDAERLHNSTGLNKKIKFKFSMLRQLGIF